jgi:hypothetical protein
MQIKNIAEGDDPALLRRGRASQARRKMRLQDPAERPDAVLKTETSRRSGKRSASSQQHRVRRRPASSRRWPREQPPWSPAGLRQAPWISPRVTKIKAASVKAVNAGRSSRLGHRPEHPPAWARRPLRATAGNIKCVEAAGAAAGAFFDRAAAGLESLTRTRRRRSCSSTRRTTRKFKGGGHLRRPRVRRLDPHRSRRGRQPEKVRGTSRGLGASWAAASSLSPEPQRSRMAPSNADRQRAAVHPA